jgi:hypothetical protein
MRKNLVSMLGVLAMGAVAMIPIKSTGQQLSIGNYWASTKNEGVSYTSSGSDVAYTNKQDFQIYDLDNNGVTNSARGVDTTENSTFQILLEYKKAVVDGTINNQRMRFKTAGGTSFPGNTFQGMVVTYKTIDHTGVRTFDLGKECALAGANPFDLPMPTTSNAVPGVYSTNYLHFARIDSTMPNLEVIAGDSTNATIRVNLVLPGENVVLESRTNLVEGPWLPFKTNYIPVTTDNFGTTDSTIFLNVPIDQSRVFFRARVQ